DLVPEGWVRVDHHVGAEHAAQPTGLQREPDRRDGPVWRGRLARLEPVVDGRRPAGRGIHQQDRDAVLVDAQRRPPHEGHSALILVPRRDTLMCPGTGGQPSLTATWPRSSTI